MRQAQIIDGKAIAEDLRSRIGQKVSSLKKTHNLTPGLAVVIVGENPASQVYVRNKAKQSEHVGIASFIHRLPEDCAQESLLALVAQLNANKAVHGILVQLPLPDHMDSSAILNAIDPDKDVDGFHPISAGRLLTAQAGLIPCTPLGCIILAKHITPDLSGAHAVVIGRSNIVGKPVAQLLLQANCTVTMSHSRTKDLPRVAAQADILVAAVGRPEMVKADWVKPGATVIDVGINRVAAPEKGDGKTKLVGDVDFTGVAEVAGAITPVPGGVGPMTIACLLRNTLQAAYHSANLEMPDL